MTNWETEAAKWINSALVYIADEGKTELAERKDTRKGLYKTAKAILDEFAYRATKTYSTRN